MDALIKVEQQDTRNYWNEILAFIRNAPNAESKKNAEMLLDQLNTASGHRVKEEIKRFLLLNTRQTISNERH
jgi:hypothetical protein